jgi:hypothetical protein
LQQGAHLGVEAQLLLIARLHLSLNFGGLVSRLLHDAAGIFLAVSHNEFCLFLGIAPHLVGCFLREGESGSQILVFFLFFLEHLTAASEFLTQPVGLLKRRPEAGRHFLQKLLDLAGVAPEKPVLEGLVHDIYGCNGLSHGKPSLYL